MHKEVQTLPQLMTHVAIRAIEVVIKQLQSITATAHHTGYSRVLLEILIFASGHDNLHRSAATTVRHFSLNYVLSVQLGTRY